MSDAGHASWFAPYRIGIWLSACHASLARGTVRPSTPSITGPTTRSPSPFRQRARRQRNSKHVSSANNALERTACYASREWTTHPSLLARGSHTSDPKASQQKPQSGTKLTNGVAERAVQVTTRHTLQILLISAPKLQRVAGCYPRRMLNISFHAADCPPPGQCISAGAVQRVSSAAAHASIWFVGVPLFAPRTSATTSSGRVSSRLCSSATTRAEVPKGWRWAMCDPSVGVLRAQ